jgi:hypothetical protein
LLWNSKKSCFCLIWFFNIVMLNPLAKLMEFLFAFTLRSLLMNVCLWKRNEDFRSSESNFLLIHKVWLGKSMQSHFTFFTVLHKCLTFCLRQVKKTIVKTKQAMTQSIWKPVSAICWFKSLTFYPRDLNTFTKPFFVYFEFLFFFALRNTNWKRLIFELLLFGAVV